VFVTEDADDTERDVDAHLGDKDDFPRDFLYGKHAQAMPWFF